VSDRSRILIDLIIISTFVSLVAEEMDLLEAFLLDVSQGVRLVPAIGEDVETDLSADGVCQAQVCELLLQVLDEGRADVAGLVKGLEVITLLNAGVSADRRYVDHSISELDECSSLDWNVQVCDVVQDDLDHLFVVVLSDMLDE